jgi:hypothetical protein
MFKSILKNFVTTIIGTVTGLPVIYNGIQTHNKETIITGIGMFLIGLFSKDHNN